MQSKVTDVAKKIDLSLEMGKTEYVRLAAEVITQMNTEIEAMKKSFKKKPIIEMAFIRTWGVRAVLALLGASMFYKEVWPSI
jgi:hypothetical protein